MSTPTALTDQTPARRLHVGYLVAGLLFIGIAALWWLVQYDAVPPHALPYAVPLLLIAAGAVALVAQLASGRRRATATGTTHPETPTPTTEER